jgi:succinyl-diaminopimelate desuccinylase
VPESQWRQIPLPLEGPRVNLVCHKYYGPLRDEITITAHIDTVPVQGDWKFDPFRGPVEQGKIYGRGAADSKGSIASLIVAFEVLGQLKLSSRYNVTICFETDEEVGGYPGAMEMAKRGFFQGHVLSLEGSQEPEEFVAAPGMTDVYITTKGRSCHTGINFMGVNAIEEMLPIMNELMALKQQVELREVDIPSPIIEGCPLGKMRPTFTLSVLNGGEKSNVVPADCTLIVNRRYTPDQTHDSVVKEIMDAIERGRAKSKALDVVTQVLLNYPALHVNLDNPHARKLREAQKLVLGYKDEDFRQCSSARSFSLGFVQQITGLRDFYFLGAGRASSNEHGADEHTRVQDLHNLTKELVYYLTA